MNVEKAEFTVYVYLGYFIFINVTYWNLNGIQNEIKSKIDL